MFVQIMFEISNKLDIFSLLLKNIFNGVKILVTIQLWNAYIYFIFFFFFDKSKKRYLYVLGINKTELIEHWVGFINIRF